MWNKIINPNNGKKININSKLGKYILKSYIKQLGGAATSPYNNYSPYRKSLFGRILVEMTKLKVHKNLYVACHGGSMEYVEPSFKLPNNIAVIHITRHNCLSTCDIDDDINLRNKLNNDTWLITRRSKAELSYFNNCHLYLPNTFIPNQQLDWDWEKTEVDKSFGIYELGEETEHIEDNIWEEQSFPEEVPDIRKNIPRIHTGRTKLDSLQYNSYYEYSDNNEDDRLVRPKYTINFNFKGRHKTRFTMKNLITYISSRTPPGDLRIIFINNCSPPIDTRNCSEVERLKDIERLRESHYDSSHETFSQFHKFVTHNIKSIIAKLNRVSFQGPDYGYLEESEKVSFKEADEAIAKKNRDQYGCNVDDPSDICFTDCEYSNLCSKFSSKICNIYPKCENKFGIKVNCKKPCK